MYSTVAFGSSKSGLSTVGYALYNAAGTIVAARTTSGVSDLGGGFYGADVAYSAGFDGYIKWDTGEGSPLYATAAVKVATEPPTTAAIADKLLGRNLAGGSDGGRTVTQALAAARNKVAFDVPAAGQFTVYGTDDSTPLWTGTYSRGANTLGPLTGTDPS